MGIRVYAILYYEDDPGKNTALKMIKMGIAEPINKRGVRGAPVVLNPFSRVYLGAWLKERILKHGIVVVDASWKKLSAGRFKGIRGLHVKLPPLFPGNPVNYGKLCMLSSVEAVAAAVYLTGFLEYYEKLLGLYKWMATFHELNKELLEEYSKAGSNEELMEVIAECWGNENPCNMVNSENGGGAGA